MHLTVNIMRNNWPNEKKNINEHLTKSNRTRFAKSKPLQKKSKSKLYDILVSMKMKSPQNKQNAVLSFKC